MNITADMIKELRQKTGAGIMECKEALKECDADIQAANDYLRKKGAGKAARKADRSTKEGAIATAVINGSGALIEVKCETDFVSRNENFQTLAKSIAEHVLKAPFEADADSFMSQALTEDSSKTVKDVINEKVHELGENIIVGRRVRVDGPKPGGFGSYVHGLGSIGTLVEVACDSEETASSPQFAGLLHDLAMHVAASNPLAIGPEDISEEAVAKEKEIFEAQAIESGKPEKIIPKIVEGKLKKYYTEACLLEQPFVKDPDKTVGRFIQETSKTLGTEISVKSFHRYQLGE